MSESGSNSCVLSEFLLQLKCKRRISHSALDPQSASSLGGKPEVSNSFGPTCPGQHFLELGEATWFRSLKVVRFMCWRLD